MQGVRARIAGCVMLALHEQYIVAPSGEKKSVVLGYAEWLKILDVLEEYDDMLAYDRAKLEPSCPIAYDTAIKILK